MKIEHIGLWVKDMDKMKSFYETYFNAEASELYHNTKTEFKSHFLTFESGARLELMTRPDIVHRIDGGEVLGFTHFAFSVGSEEDVDALVKVLVNDGYKLLNGPRITGDGYYEAVIQDPENNLIEITI